MQLTLKMGEIPIMCPREPQKEKEMKKIREEDQDYERLMFVVLMEKMEKN